MNLKCGFRRITLVVSILVFIICVSITIGILMSKRSSALRHLANCEKEFLDSIPVMNLTASGVWPIWSPERQSYSEYLLELGMSFENIFAYLPVRTGEEDKKYREEHNIPPDSSARFYTDESMKIVRRFRTCIDKFRLFQIAYYTRQLPVGLIFLMSFGCGAAGFISTWLVYGIVCFVIKGFYNDTG